MQLDVDCYSGRKADERPIRFRLDQRQYWIEEVVNQWYGLSDVFFQVRADDGNQYTLRRDMKAEGSWHLVSFGELPRNG